MIELENLHKRFGNQIVLSGVSLKLSRGETIAIVGPSGTGKSVTLKLITGLLQPDAGEVLVDGESMNHAPSEKARERLRAKMGMLFQRAALFDSLSLLENVAFPLQYHSKKRNREIFQEAISALADVGLSGFERHLPGEVSIGMRKRVGLARALITKPDLVLFDEPNTGLDPETGQEIYELIKRKSEENGFAGIVVSHEIPEVFQVCDRITMLCNGKVQHDGSVDAFQRSTNPFVVQFRNGSVKGPIQAQ